MTWATAMRALAELDVLVLDCQATGASPAFGHVLELGWGTIRAGAGALKHAQAHWITLPDGHHVPPQIKKLTGYESAFASEAISDAEAWRRLRHTAGADAPVPVAIHYARFELAFLREWSARFEPDAPFPFDAVCVHAVALRLYPDLPRQSIRALAGYLGHGLHLTRRALGHVEATAFVWRRLCAELESRGVTTWEDLRAFVAERPSRSRALKRRYPIDPSQYRAQPDEPGVYRFLRNNGDVLYVGKATSLKKRTASHFAGRGGTLQSPEMLTQVSEIAVTVVPSALEAALLENDTIKALRPPYNVQLTANDAPVWYSTRDFTAAVPVPDEAHPLGPLSSEYALRALSSVIALASGAPATAEERAGAVGVSALFTPDEFVFFAGWAELVARHPSELTPGGDARMRVFRLARRLLRAEPATAEPKTEAEEAGESPSRDWDAPRVARHIENALVQAYRVYRRAHFMRLLYDSDIVFREPGAERVRLLRMRKGAVAEARDALPVDRSIPAVRPALYGAASVAFDRATYDRLRILTTELKRIHRDGGFVAVAWGSARSIPERFVRGVLALV
jgi:DNA polymerase-3 subunit epsilon